jgi:hypothetical protein
VVSPAVGGNQDLTSPEVASSSPREASTGDTPGHTPDAVKSSEGDLKPEDKDVSVPENPRDSASETSQPQENSLKDDGVQLEDAQGKVPETTKDQTSPDDKGVSNEGSGGKRAPKTTGTGNERAGPQGASGGGTDE